ncbi:YigZ family protein [Segetibacter sp. 3557_3]|uniref:IMPACT family protein n=1 Tax=Segetibacter sp. 3557_3 TaxID=2547429 RepID=UPI001058DEA3|nr:YigZ family protein [Segetibacter sp. 3557_3]TDH27742.1 YigZ family protein [Segetibacter sp. 3557_3]
MKEKFYYYTIEKPSVAEFKDRGSKFIAYAFPLSDTDIFKKHLQALKKEHPKAVHFCFAYRIGTDGNNFRTSDDGEPAGSAGKPILGQIDSKELSDVLVIVVRYFGGTLLGVPGLINAYKTTTALALQLTPNIQKPVTENYNLSFDYTRLNDVMLVLKKLKCTVLKSEVQLFCNMQVAMPKENAGQVIDKLHDLQNIEVTKMEG